MTSRARPFPLRLHRDTAGASSIETALSLVLAICMVFLGFELCLYAYTLAVVNDSAKVGVRYAIIHGTDSSNCSGPSQGCADSSGANVVATVQQYGANYFSALSNAQVSVSYLDASSAPPSRVQVTVNFTYSPVFTTSFATQTIQASSEGRIVY